MPINNEFAIGAQNAQKRKLRMRPQYFILAGNRMQNEFKILKRTFTRSHTGLP